MEWNKKSEPVDQDEYQDEEKKPVLTIDTSETVRLYKRRWLMLAIFSLFSLSSAYQWIHLGIIGNIIVSYYNSSLPEDRFQQDTVIDWLSLSYLVCYVPFIFPAMWLLDKKGLKVNNVVGTVLNAVGAWLKCASLGTDRFAVLMIGQIVCAVAEVFVVSIPPRLAAVWFGPKEVSTATSIGVFGNQVGVAIGFLLPPLLVPNSQHLDVVSGGLSVMFYGGAVVCTVILLLMLIVYQKEPPLPPSRAQKLAKQVLVQNNYLMSLKRLVSNPGFVLIAISYGINTGAFYAISILLNPMVLFYFQGEEQSVGLIGLTIVLTGICGAVVAGIWLDRTRTYKSTSTAIYFLAWAGMLAFTVILYFNLGHIWLVFLTAGFLGFFMTGYLPVGYEFASEITYPESEGTSSGILTASAMFFGIVLTLGMRAMMNGVSILAANTFLTIALFVGGVMTALVKPDYRRQEAEKEIINHLDHIGFTVIPDESVENPPLK
ncbi:feline leukemia virus subgroup C receptor-related protein 2-like [Gigantopelta aegis]|uniref:feline leukemia virus subgroup C receptor-related protein 2-like n=1 Tax=Gigantopelta aegis TaxID=1735272 RepID=UPI001B887517|nr:feline leukemia virus subgroup C receptor-related protein 2-like [Gigantopelta aegis]